MVLAVAALPSLALPVEVHGATNYKTAYSVFLGVVDFREADHSANVSITLTAQLPMISGPPGGFSLLVQAPGGGQGFAEANSSCIDVACTEGFWNFHLYARFTASGVTDFYPYDAWKLNITLTSLVLNEANTTNTDIGARSYVPGWGLIAGPATHIVNTGWGVITVPMTLQRASWSTTPIRYVPIFLFLVLGLTALIPADDLASKTTVVTSVIFFIAASIFSLGPSLPPRFYGPSFAETVFFYLLMLAAVYLGESILENRAIGQVKKAGKIHVLIQFALQVTVLGLAINWILTYTGSFISLASSAYPWSAPDLLETRYLPIVSVALGTLMNIGLRLAKDHL